MQVATLEALPVLGVTNAPTPEAFAQSAALRIDHDVVPSPVIVTAADGAEHKVPAVDVRTGTVGVLGILAVAPDVASRIGLDRTTSLSLIVDLGLPVREDDLARTHAAELRTVGPGMQIWTSTGNNCCDTRRITFIAFRVGLAIVLPVLAFVATLTRSEAHAEPAILDAIGVGPRRRRRFAAVRMGLVDGRSRGQLALNSPMAPRPGKLKAWLTKA